MKATFSTLSALGAMVMVLLLGFSEYGTHAQEIPSPDKLYAIRSRMDGGLLYPRDSGELCESLSYVSFTYGINAPFPERYRWKVSVSNSTGLLTIHTTLESQGADLNDVTYEKQPICDPGLRELNFLPNAGSNGFILKYPKDDTCLYSYGSEVGITIWRDCNEPYVQSFQFIEIIE